MDLDLGVLYEILDCQLKKTKSEDDVKKSLSTLASKYENQLKSIRSLQCNSHVGLTNDEQGNALIPEDLPSTTSESERKAVKTTGNGDCLYNAVSLALVGNESYAMRLRLLVALELALNVKFYAQHPKFSSFPSDGRHPNTVFSLCLTKSSDKAFHDNNQDRQMAIWSEARAASTPKKWSGYFHVLALSSVLARPVFSTYPNCQSWTRDFVHGIVYPRLAIHTDPVFLLWSREGSDTRPGAWYEPNHFVPLYVTEKPDDSGEVEDKSAAKPCNNTCQSNNPKGSKQTGEWKDFKKNATTSGGSHQKNFKKGDKAGVNKPTKRGCLEQFGFCSQSSSVKKIKKEEKPNSGSTTYKEKQAETSTPAEVDSNSTGRLEKKNASYEDKRVRKFQWNWLTLFPWLRINMQCLSSNKQYDIEYPYPQVQPPNTEVSSMYCDVCSKLSLSSSSAEISKKSGSKVFKIESLKKHGKSQTHTSCVETLNARQKPQDTPLVKSLNKGMSVSDARLEKKILTAFTVVANERPFDDYETFCSLQNINGADLGETYTTRSACTEFLRHISNAITAETAVKLKESHFISVMADGGTDFGVLEEVLVYVRYLDWELGKPVSEYLAIQEPKSGSGSDVLDAISTCVAKTSGMEDSEWKEKLTGFGSDGCSVMTGSKNGVWGLLQQDPSTNNFKKFWCGAHKVELAVVKSLEHYDEFVKLRETLQSLYKEYHYSPKALRELKDLAEALEEKVSRPLNVLGARWLPHLQTALKILFDGFKVLVMHSQNTKEGRVGSAGRQGRATFSVKFLTSFKGLLFAHLTWDIVEEAAHLSKVFQADFTTITRAMAAVNNFKMRLISMKKTNGPKLQQFLQQMEDQEIFNEISIVKHGNDLKEFEVKKQRVLDDVLRNVEERFNYLENDPVLKAAAVLDPDIWPTDQMTLSSYGNEEIQVLADHYEDHLLRAGCELQQIEREWSSVKSYVSLHLNSRSTEEVFASILRSQADQCHNFLLLAEIVLIWPLSTAVVERGFSSMNRVKTLLRSSMSQENLDGVLRVSVKYHSIPKAQRPQAFINSGLLSKAVNLFRTGSIRPRREQWVETHPKARHWAGLPKKKGL